MSATLAAPCRRVAVARYYERSVQQMTQMTGGRAVVESLRAERVNHVFGLIGSAGMEVFDALYDAKDVRFIGVRDERTGTHMADGFARASGGAGVFIAGQNGPGATNLVTGLAQAHAAYSPVVAIAGLLSTAHTYRDAFQEVDQQALFRPITKKTWTVTAASRIPEMMREAFRTALTPRCGPVALNIARDMLADTIDIGDFHGFAGIARSTGDPAAIERAAAILASAAKPLIIAGGGVKTGRYHEEVLALAELLHAPVATSPGHGDALPCTHPLYAGQVGPRGNAVASGLAREADVILALGTRLGFNTTFYSWDNLSRAARLVQVEIEPTAIARFFPVEVGIVGDAGLVANALTRVLSGHTAGAAAEWAKDFRAKRRALLAERDSPPASARPIQPAALYRALRACLPEDTMFTVDAGTLCLQATDQMLFRRPPALFSPLDFGLVGFSFACGLGVKLACPERTVVSLMGDGGFGMTSSELGTAVVNGINSICIVMNNGCWGAEKSYQRDFFDGRYLGADVPNPPYDKLAALWGARGYRVDSLDQLEVAVRGALECGKPAVIDVQVDPNALYSFRRDAFKHRDKSAK
jgi:acetolactate synthase-1/2/3 large subunit/sulfoacetaldehyde acetyltransferase